ncbi:MAG: penicillin-binding protein 2 [Myxococcota bacterium]
MVPLVLLFTMLFLVLEARLFYLQIVRGADFRERARISVINEVRIPPRRGRIKDRNGKVLATNQPVYRLTLTPHFMGKNAEAIVDRLSVLLQWTRERQAKVMAKVEDAVAQNRRWDPIAISGLLHADTCPEDGTPLILAKEVQRELFCRSDGRRLHPVAPKATSCPHDRGRLTWKEGATNQASCQKCGRVFVTDWRCHGSADPDDVVTVEHNLQCKASKRHVSNQVASLQAHLYELPGVDLHTDFHRTYPYRYEAAHLLGYINRVTAEDREKHPGVYALHDRIGRTGVEAAHERTLRGTSGKALYIKDSSGRRQHDPELEGVLGNESFVAAQPGQDIWLTLDIDLQREVRAAFRYYKSGAGIVLDPRTGEILALYSKPGFDPNEWSVGLSKDSWDKINANPYTPLINKALTPYAPGSVYKLVSAIAALEQSVVVPDTTIECLGFYEFGGRRFHCHNRSGHGHVNLVEAIKHSCDVYFYKVGEMLGMERLAKYGHLFGFGEPSGISIRERVGRVPTKAWHAENTTLGWQPGLTLSTSIGQGSLTSTTLQVARAYAAIANGGYLLDTQLVREVTSNDGELLKAFKPQVVRELNVDPHGMSLVREGFVRVVNDIDGSAYDSALDAVVMAGKTGTAEAAQVRAGATAELATWLKEDHAWFSAYAPADDPQVVVVVFLEHGGWGSKVAAPVASRIMKSWLRLGMYDPPPTDGELEAEETR